MAKMEDDHKQIERAMAWRVKYRVDPVKPKRRQPLGTLGGHMMNRGPHSTYPNGKDVRSLGLDLIKGCFDYDEANHNGVAVEEVPPEVRCSARVFLDPCTKGAYEGIGSYNERMARHSEFIQGCFTLVTARGVVAGTLSHTHLLLRPAVSPRGPSGT